MKTIITLFLLSISLLGAGQRKLDITIIGTAHHFSDEYKSLQDFESAQNFIVNLSPDIICIESIPTDDTLSFNEIWPNTAKRADRLRDSLKYHETSSKDHPFWETYGDKDQLITGAKYYAAHDLWNAYYQWFQATEAGDSLFYFSRFQRNLSNSEYGLIVFPAAQRLGISEFYNIDYRAGESVFMTNNSKVFKKLFFGLKWKPLRVYLKTQKKYRKAEKEGKLMEFINGPEFQDSFSQLIDELPKRLRKSEEAKQVKEYWLMRNEIMTNRLIQRAEEQQATKVLLTVGSAHITHMKRFLEAKGHHVSTYGEFISNQNN